MDMDMDSDASCKIEMLWNWNTIDSCFLSEQWHIRTKGQYAGSVVAIFFIVILLEGCRRYSRELDRKIKADFLERQAYLNKTNSMNKSDSPVSASELVRVKITPTWYQHIVRSFLYFVQFSTSYIVMLLAMYYNGGVLFAIFFASFFGHYFFAWDTLGEVDVPGSRGECCCA